MTKPALKLCVLTVSLLSMIALGARSATADPPAHNKLLDLFGVSVCANGAVNTDCRSPDRAGGAQPDPIMTSAAAAFDSVREVIPTRPEFQTLSFFGMTMCVGEVPWPVSIACDIQVPRGSHAAQ